MEYHSRTSIRNLRKRQQARASAAAASAPGPSSVSGPPASTAAAVARDHQQDHKVPSHATKGYDELDQQRLEVIKMISDQLETGLNDETLSAVLELLRQGYHPDAIISVIRSLS